MRRRRHGFGRATAAFLVCPLASVTVPWILAGGGPLPDIKVLFPFIELGVLLGAVRLVLRPVVRLITAPLGCITLGLSGVVIDILLIYFAQRFVPGIQGVTLLCATLTAFVINVVCAIIT